MPKRFVSLWFRYLLTDWLMLRQPELTGAPFVFAVKERGRMIITAANKLAEAQGINKGMAAADAKAIIPGLVIVDDIPGKGNQLLKGLGLWCIRYTPIIAIDAPDGLIMDVSGCTHLWGNEQQYLNEIINRLKSKGYYAKGAMADTVGAAWAMAHFGPSAQIVESY